MCDQQDDRAHYDQGPPCHQDRAFPEAESLLDRSCGTLSSVLRGSKDEVLGWTPLFMHGAYSRKTKCMGIETTANFETELGAEESPEEERSSVVATG